MTIQNFETAVTRACADVGRRVLSDLPAMDDDTRNALASLAWHEFVRMIFEEPKARAWFREDTGIDLDARRDSLEQLIKEGTGRDRKAAEQFIMWATETLWGFESAPKAYQDAIAKRRAEVTP